MNRRAWAGARVAHARVAGRAAAALVAAAAGSAAAHDGASASGTTIEPWLALVLAAGALLYARGAARAWRRAGPGRAVGPARALAFAAGWLVTVAALAPPIDPLGQQLFSMHMVQHELLMVVAAPLLALGRPFIAWSWAWPAAASRVHRAFAAGWRRSAWRALTSPLGAWALHAAALWLWHAPRAFEAALASRTLHELQHASFFVTALLFWWSILGHGAPARRPGAALLALFTTMLHTGILGALLTLSPRIWYAAYVPTATALGIDPLHDQQVGGLLMWVPGGAAYIAAALVVVFRLLQTAPAPPSAGAPGTAAR